jgi:hypothetical protein
MDRTTHFRFAEVGVVMSDSESTPKGAKTPNCDQTPYQAIPEASNSPATASLLVVAGQKARSERISKGLSAYRTPLEILADKPNSMRAVINAMCYDCQGGDHADTGWQWAVGNCQLLTCPMWNFRPYKQLLTCPMWNFRPYKHKVGNPGEGVYKQYYGESQDARESPRNG